MIDHSRVHELRPVSWCSWQRCQLRVVDILQNFDRVVLSLRGATCCYADLDPSVPIVWLKTRHS